MHPWLEELARERVTAVLGAGSKVAGVTALQSGDDAAVVRVTLAGPSRRLVLKVAGARAPSAVDFERTAAMSALARASGVPVAAVLAAGTTPGVGPGPGDCRYLLQEHVEGAQWRRVRPLLDPEELDAAHREIATAVLALQSTRFAGFGELGVGSRPAADLAGALRRRAELCIADERRRALFCELLDREAGLIAGDRSTPVLCHDDLHHANVIFRLERGTWRLAGILDWDKAWAGPAESDVARMAFWDDMTGAGGLAGLSRRGPARRGTRRTNAHPPAPVVPGVRRRHASTSCRHSDAVPPARSARPCVARARAGRRTPAPDAVRGRAACPRGATPAGTSKVYFSSNSCQSPGNNLNPTGTGGAPDRRPRAGRGSRPLCGHGLRARLCVVPNHRDR